MDGWGGDCRRQVWTLLHLLRPLSFQQAEVPRPFLHAVRTPRCAHAAQTNSSCRSFALNGARLSQLPPMRARRRGPGMGARLRLSSSAAGRLAVLKRQLPTIS